MREICKFDKKADIQQVEQPSVRDDLKGQIRNGIVRNTASECFYNEQKQVSEVGGRVRDVFDIVEASGTIDGMLRASEKPDND